jgi:hypothetical protein
MSGNPASAPQVPPAGQPPANEPQGGNNPVPAIPGNPAQPPAQKPSDFIVSQEQWNQRWGEEHGKIEKDLGMSIKDAKAFIAANKTPPKPAPTGETLSGADLKLAKTFALMNAGVLPKLIPEAVDLLNIHGKTKEEIDVSVQRLISVGLLKIEETKPPVQPGTQPTPAAPNNAQGAGNPGVPPGPKIWTRDELGKLSPEEYEKNRADITKAMSEGRIKG